MCATRFVQDVYVRRNGLVVFEDEIRWSVGRWNVPVEGFGVVLDLPDVPKDGIKRPQDSERYRTYIDDSGRVVFESTGILRSDETLDLVVQRKEGYVGRTKPIENVVKNAAFPMVFFLISGIYYLVLWAILGRDPPRGTIAPRFYPPKGMSPAAVRFVMNMGYDSGCLVADILSLMFKGKVKIEREGENGPYILKYVKKGRVKLEEDEKLLRKHLRKLKKVVLSSDVFNEELVRMESILSQNLRQRFGKYFKTNTFFTFLPPVLYLGFVVWSISQQIDLTRAFKFMIGYVGKSLWGGVFALSLVFGILFISFLVLHQAVVIILAYVKGSDAMFSVQPRNGIMGVMRKTLSDLMNVVLSIEKKEKDEYHFVLKYLFAPIYGLISRLALSVLIAFSILTLLAFVVFRMAYGIGYVTARIYTFILRSRFKRFFGAFVSLTVLVVILTALVAMMMLISLIPPSPQPIVLTLASLPLLIMAWIWDYYMRRPTKEGRRLMDEIEGFRQFLLTVEKEKLRRIYNRDLPEIYERFLPYAYAMGIEDAWVGKFEYGLKIPEVLNRVKEMLGV